MGRFTVRQHGPPIRFTFGTQDIHRSGRRSRVDGKTTRDGFVINYLDDFLVITAADEHQGSHAMRLLLETFGTPRSPNSVGQAGKPVAMLDFPRV